MLISGLGALATREGVYLGFYLYVGNECFDLYVTGKVYRRFVV